MQQHFEQRHSTDIPSLKDVVVELQPALSSWYLLGVSLDISPYELDSIRKNYLDTDYAFHTMLHSWFNQSIEPTWETIVESLHSIGEHALAQKIEARHCYNQ